MQLLPFGTELLFDPRWSWGTLLAVSLLLAVGTAILYWPRRIELSGAARTMLTACRLLAFAILLVCLARPSIRQAISSEHDPNLVVAIDVSRSMSIEDYDGPTSRLERLRDALQQGGFFRELQRRYRLRLFEFDTEAREAVSLDALATKGDHTDLAGSVEELAQAAVDANTIAVLFATDGADNAGEGVLASTGPLERKGVPLLAIGVGAEEVRDISIAAIATRKIVRLNTTVEVRVRLRHTGFLHHLVPVVVARAGDEIARKEAALKEDDVTVVFEFTPTEEGLARYEVFVPVQPGEVIPENNRRGFSVNASRRKIRVLYLEGSQYRRANRQFWEYQYLVQALLEDEDVEVTPVFRNDVKAAQEAGIGYVTHPDKGFPRERRQLFSYDVIISSDIDIELFTQGQLANLVEFVGEHGGGFVMVGGWTSFGAGGYDESIIDQMLPVDMLGRQDRYTENVSFRWQLAPEAYDHPIMRLVDDPDRNRAVWKSMPHFKGYNNVLRAKPGATALAVHPTDRTQYGRRVMLAVQHYGKGRSMAFMPDTTAGWGEDFEDFFGEGGDNRYYRKFWKNAIRWLAAYRLNVPSQLVALQTSRNLYERGETARIEVAVLDTEYEPSGDAEVELEVRLPSGEVIRRRLAPDLNREGIYAWDLALPAAGTYRLSARAREAAGLLGEDRAEFGVEGSTAEFRNFALNRSLLSALAERTHGKYYRLEEVSALLGDLTDTNRRTVRTEVRDLWDRPLVYLALIALFSVEWAVRRKKGLL